MKIRGLLAGSAAALATASTAYAADPIVYVEPEPMEYVRICDVYGAGFFYIPGTETCLQISGFVRFELGATSDDGPFDTPNFHGFVDPDGWNHNTRARLNFDARSETEYGTLRSYIRLQSDSYSFDDGSSYQSDEPVVIDQAYIELGGLLMGYTESLWDGHGGFSDLGMSYGYQQRQQIRYSFAANGFGGAVSVEGYDGMEYMPDVVGELSFSQAWGSILGTIGYDDDADGFGAALSGTVNIGATGGAFKVSGFYSDEPDVAYGAFMFDGAAAEWSVLAAYQQPIGETLTGIIEYQYLDSHFADTHQHAVLGSLVWLPVTGFEVRTELAWTKAEDDGLDLDDSFSGFLRFERSF